MLFLVCVSVISALLSPAIDQRWRIGSAERAVRPIFGASLPIVVLGDLCALIAHSRPKMGTRFR
jgi:hypothetical protein